MGQQFSRLPSGFQPGVDSWYGVVCSQFHFIPDFREPDIQDYFLKQCVYSGSFIGLLLLLSWYYGQSSLKNRLDPVGAANEERTAAIKERDDAQRAWVEMGTKHERAMGTNLELRAELSTAFKDLPWLKHRNTELAEENSVQHNEIERLEGFKQDYDELLQHVSAYGMSAKRPEYYQQRSEQTQRQLEISNNLLEKSEKCVKALEEKLGTQREKDNKEKEWLRSRLKKNARSTAYWAKYRPNALDTKPAWGVRCACTEPEIAYGLKDQNPRIVELEATVAARDLTIKRLRERRPVWNSGKNYAASTSNADHTSLLSTEVLKSDSITGSQTLTTTLVHTCEYEEQCKTLGKQVADDAETIRQLRKECQDLGEPASNKATADTVEFDATAELKGQLAANDTEIKDLRAEKEVMSDEVGAKNETINGLRKEKVTGSEELAKNNQAIKDLREEKVTMGEELAAKDKEINDLWEEKTTADKNATTAISDLRQEISDSRISLVEARKVSAECEYELGEQKTKISELEAAHRGLEDAVKRKDREINDLQKKNQEIAEQPAPGYAENLQRLTTANSDLDDLRREHCECKGHSESQKARISELEAAGRELRATIKVKDDRITELEGQINNAPSNDLIERHIQSQNDAISNKDRDYQALYDLYNKMLGQEALAEAKHNEDMQSLNTMQQSVTAKQLELQRLWDEYNNLRSHHTNCEGRTTDLTNQLRQGANTYTDLQTKYNTQATELDVVNQNARGLRSEVANLQQTNANLEQMNSSSESNFEKYRIEGENRARPSWQANFDREMSTQALKLEASEGQVFKLENQLQQAKNQASPLREMQIKAREDAVQLKEDALKLDKDAMDHDQDGSKEDHEIKTLENKLAAANKDAGDARVRNRGIQSQLNKERKERADEKARHEKVLEKEREDSERRSDFLKLRLERENPLKGTVSNLQDEVARLSKELGEQQSRENDG